MSEPSRRAFVLGLDGVPWDRLVTWVEAGELPNVAALFEEGATGPLDSTRPANTALAWPSIVTGVRPDKHGLYAFYTLHPDYTHSVNTGADLRGPTLWDRLSPATVANVPMTYPAGEMDGRMVAGMMTPDAEEQGFTHPPGLATEIEQTIPDYEIGLDWNDYHGREDTFREDLSDLLTARRALFDRLAETDWRLFFFVFTAPDRLQHLVWEEEALLEHYRELDAVIGEAREHASQRNANLFVVSDHGFGPVSRAVHPNSVLAHEGYLAPKSTAGSRSVLERAGLTKSTVMDALGRVGIDDETLVEHLPASLIDGAAARIPGDNARYDVEYGETKAFVHGQGNLYINDTDRFEQGVVAPERRADLADELAELFADLRDPDTGERVLTVHEGEECFPTDPDAPDLVLEPAAGYKLKLSLAPAVFTTPDALAADHRPDGVFLAAGPDIEPGASPEDATVFDLAPTVLHSAGEAVPERTDGRVLTEIFASDSPAADREIERVAVGESDADAGSDADAEDFEDVEDRLKGLGYME